MPKKKVRSLWPVAIVNLIVLALAALLVLQRPDEGALNIGLRLAALVGLGLVFLSIWSSLFARELTKAFGRPFVTVHHVLSVVGLALATLHPLGVALERASLAEVLPRFSSWDRFLWRLGPIVWLLLVLGLVGALLRSKWKGWRWLHWANYMAFFVGVQHAIRQGTDIKASGIRVLLALMALSVIVAFVWKRLKMARKPTRKPISS